jgi:DNA-damage-inducible protein J
LIIISTARISINVDERVKQDAQQVFGEIGMDMTTAIDLFLRTSIREGQIPFKLQTERAYRESAYNAYIKTELEKSIQEAADPDTIWLSHEEIMANATRRREARNRV